MMESNPKEGGQKPRKWRYSHGAKDTAEKLQEQWETPQMRERGDAPHEAEEPPNG